MCSHRKEPEQGPPELDASCVHSPQRLMPLGLLSCHMREISPVSVPGKWGTSDFKIKLVLPGTSAGSSVSRQAKAASSTPGQMPLSPFLSQNQPTNQPLEKYSFGRNDSMHSTMAVINVYENTVSVLWILLWIYLTFILQGIVIRPIVPFPPLPLTPMKKACERRDTSTISLIKILGSLPNIADFKTSSELYEGNIGKLQLAQLLSFILWTRTQYHATLYSL